MIALAFWSLALAAIGYLALSIWRAVIGGRAGKAPLLALAFAGMAFWAGSILTKVTSLIVVGEALRDLAWLVYIYNATRSFAQDRETRRWTTSLNMVLIGLVILRAAVTSPLLVTNLAPPAQAAAILLSLALSLLFAITALIFIHNIYLATASSAASGFRLVLVALGVLWAYDINLFTLTLLGHQMAIPLAQGRGLVALFLTPSFALAARRKERWKITLSRQATARSLLLVVIGAYFVAVSLATRVTVWVGGNAADVVAVSLALGMSIAGALIILSPQALARLKIILIKHFFEHRYDYRSEWLRFSATIAEGHGAGSSPEERVIRSVAEVTESTGGLLLLVDRKGRLKHAGGWHWTTQPLEDAIDINPLWTKLLEKSGRITTFDTLRIGEGGQEEAGLVPAWLLDAQEAWAAVPLVRSHRLIGIVVLGRPRVDRLLDWEDFDLLKVIGQQAAIHLAETQSQNELEEARRFDEFNRRFAFIIHDIKNVVSQLSLVASNAEQHGANPRFQRDMADTLKNASIKMNNLLSRLSSKRSFAETELSAVDVNAMLEKIASDRRAQHEISVIVEKEVRALADPEKLRLAIDHLVQNAIEASPASDPVILASTEWEGRARITISDKGPGMSPEFVRKDLFKPFLSTKEGGFGIGAAEARSLVDAMDGTLDVVTAEGRGARFTIELASGGCA